VFHCSNGEQYAFELGQASTSLPDKTYFLEKSDDMEAHRKVTSCLKGTRAHRARPAKLAQHHDAE
jgi:hypothetical protein